MSKYLAPAAYLPHQAPMLLIDEVVAVSADTVCCCSVVDNDHALAPFITLQGVPSFFSLELMAQTIGVWAGFWELSRSGHKIEAGMLLGGRDFKFSTPFLPLNATLSLEAQLLLSDDKVGSFEAQVRVGSDILACGRINTLQASLGELDSLVHV